MLVTDFGVSSGIEHFVHQIDSEFEKNTVCHTSKKQTCHSNMKIFIAAPSQELLNLAKKSDILDIASHYSISSVKTSMLKHEIKNIIIQFFVDEEVFKLFIYLFTYLFICLYVFTAFICLIKVVKFKLLGCFSLYLSSYACS